MSVAAVGRPEKLDGEIYAGTKKALLIKQRIHALIGQALDEVDRRRARGKSDVVAKIADAIEKDPLAALRSLQELLPKNDDAASKVPAPTLSMQALFVQAARTVSEIERKGRDAIPPNASLLELVANAEPVPDAEPSSARPEDDRIDW